VGILPLIDLLVLVGSGTLIVGFLLKAVDIVTRYQPTILGFSSVDFLLMTGVVWLFALVLAARTWVKLNEPKLLELRRAEFDREARRRADDRIYSADRCEEADAAGETAHEAAAGEAGAGRGGA
jgi:hypothetical protein